MMIKVECIRFFFFFTHHKGCGECKRKGKHIHRVLPTTYTRGLASDDDDDEKTLKCKIFTKNIQNNEDN